MAMEYIYLEQDVKEPVALKRFRGLKYSYDSYDGALLIMDEQGEHVANFWVKPRLCYILQRRNKSALQLHEVHPPFKCIDQLLWLFGFGRKQRCESQKDFTQKCFECQQTDLSLTLITKEYHRNGLHLWYAFTREDDFALPLAYYWEVNEGTTWAMYSKEAEYELVRELHQEFNEFRYPLQYAIHIFRSSTMSYPVETRKFFREQLRYYNRSDVYYADLPGDF